MLEPVKNCDNIARVLKNYDNDIKKYLREYNPDPNGPYGIKSEVLETFVKSCGKCLRFKVCVCVCVHLCENENENEDEKQRERERGRESKRVSELNCTTFGGNGLISSPAPSFSQCIE
jgi:hypothetical protein